MVVGLPNNEGRSREVTLGKKHGTESDNTYICLIIALSEFKPWKVIAPEPSKAEHQTFNQNVNGLY